MSFQTKLFLELLAIVLASIAIVAYGVNHYTRQTFEEVDARQTQAQITQFEQQLSRFGKEVARRVENVSNAEETITMAVDFARGHANPSLYVHDAIGAARERNLDLLEITSWDDTVVSSAQYPSQVGRKVDGISANKDWSNSPAFFEKEQLPDGNTLSLSAVRSCGAGDKNLRIVGGRLVDQNFLSLFELYPNMRVLLYRNFNDSTFDPSDLLDRNGVVPRAERFAPLVKQVQRRPEPLAETIQWTAEPSSAEAFYLVPLLGRNKELLGIFLVGGSRRDFVLFTGRIKWIAVSFAAAAFVIALPVCFWCSWRISRLVRREKPAAE